MIHTTENQASLVLINGVVYPLDEANTPAEAVAISGDRIVGIGTTAEILAAFKSKNVIDLKGKTVMPGLVDGHAHVVGEGGRLATLDIVGTKSPEQIIGMLAERIQSSRAQQWIIGRGWDQNTWPVKEFPTHDMLDKVSANNPVVLRRVDGHAMWVNKMVLDIAGITSQTPEIDGGKIYRDKSGNPTGVFVDNAMELIDKVIPDLTPDEVQERVEAALKECAQLGLTEVHDMGTDLQTIEIYRKLIDSGKCPIRVYAAIGDANFRAEANAKHTNTWEYYLQHGPEIGYGDGMLTVRSVKLYMDGALGSRGAALLDEYSDDPGNRGLTTMHENELDAICRQASEKGFQVCVHAIGDRANSIVLNEYEKVLNERPKNAPSPRWRIEHAQILKVSDIPRFASLGVLPSMQPTHATSDMLWAESRVGPERIKGAYSWKSILNTGSIIVSGSDFPVEGVNPLWGFYAAITRTNRDGYPQDGWRREERMSRLEAARSFTEWAAYGAFQEGMKGTIEPGKWADLTILSKDIMQINPEEVLKTDVEMTIVGGRIVYQKPGASSDSTGQSASPAGSTDSTAQTGS